MSQRNEQDSGKSIWFYIIGALFVFVPEYALLIIFLGVALAGLWYVNPTRKKRPNDFKEEVYTGQRKKESNNRSSVGSSLSGMGEFLNDIVEALDLEEDLPSGGRSQFANPDRTRRSSVETREKLKRAPQPKPKPKPQAQVQGVAPAQQVQPPTPKPQTVRPQPQPTLQTNVQPVKPEVSAKKERVVTHKAKVKPVKPPKPKKPAKTKVPLTHGSVASVKPRRKPTPPMTRGTTFQPQTTVFNLRQAVLAQEILGQPRALKEDW